MSDPKHAKDLSDMIAQGVDALSKVDWPRAFQMLGSFLRAVRGDEPEHVQRESMRASEKGAQTRQSLENMARMAAGCRAPAPCHCSFCEQEREG